MICDAPFRTLSALRWLKKMRKHLCRVSTLDSLPGTTFDLMITHLQSKPAYTVYFPDVPAHQLTKHSHLSTTNHLPSTFSCSCRNCIKPDVKLEARYDSELQRQASTKFSSISGHRSCHLSSDCPLDCPRRQIGHTRRIYRDLALNHLHR